MPKLRILQSNFSAGEISPTGAGRVDIQLYANAASRLVNVISRPLGGAKKRAGMQHIAATKDSTKRSRLIPYIKDRDTAYMIEAGATYMRFFRTDGTPVLVSSTPYEITTPYTEAQVGELDYSQAEDQMFLFHGDVYPNRLRIFEETKWQCQDVPFTTTPYAELGTYPAAGLTLSSNTVGTGRTMTADSACFLAADVGRAIIWVGGIAIITGYTSTTVVTVEVKTVFDSATIPTGVWNLDSSPQCDCKPSLKKPVGTLMTLTLTAAGWRAEDVGKFVRINSGLVKILGYTSATVVSGAIIIELFADVAAPGLAWTLESSVWGGLNGYPRTGTTHQQRLVVAGTKRNPQSVFGSRSGEPLDFTLGTDDDMGFFFTMAGNDNQVNLIHFLASSRDLLALTYGGEYSLTGGVEKPITPTNVQIRLQTGHGSAEIRPLSVGTESLFVQRAGHKLRAMGYEYSNDAYQSPDLTTLAEQITETGVAGMVFQQEPDPVVWIWLNNGRFISLTLDRELKIIAWNRHETDGAVESMATMPSGDREQVWMIVRREVNGQIVRYVERFQPDWYPVYGTSSPDPNAFPPGDEPFSWGFQLDCATTADGATGSDTWTGLDHLEGKTVRCLADGEDMPPMKVAGGTIVLPRTAKRILVGLMFAPRIIPLIPELQGGVSTIQGTAMSTNEFILRLINTIGATVNGAQVSPGRIIGPDQLDRAPQLVSGDKPVSLVGWEKGRSEIVISQDDPFPFHLLATVRSITVNEG